MAWGDVSAVHVEEDFSMKGLHRLRAGFYPTEIGRLKRVPLKAES